MKHFVALAFLISLISCQAKVGFDKRIVANFRFSDAQVLNYSDLKKSYRFIGNVKGGIDMVKVKGLIEIKKDSLIVILEEQDTSGNLIQTKEAAWIKRCLFEKKNDGYLKYEYKTDNGEYTVLINPKGAIYSVIFNDWVDHITFTSYEPITIK
jgi:hypothetical protein